MTETFAEFERVLIRERQRGGIAAGVERGVYRGHRSPSTAAPVTELARRSAAGEPKRTANAPHPRASLKRQGVSHPLALVRRMTVDSRDSTVRGRAPRRWQGRSAAPVRCVRGGGRVHAVCMALRGVLHPRRARCSVCRVTHVLLPVTVLLRRAYAVEVIGAALMARAGGSGIGRSGRRWSSGGDGAGLAAGDERPVGGGADAVAGGGPPRWGGQPVPKALGSPWRSVLAALGSATTAVTGRFGVFGVLGPVTAWQVAAACSAGWLLSPGGHPDTTGDASRL